MTSAQDTLPLIDDELDVLAGLVRLAGQDNIELGCGAAQLARTLLGCHPDGRVHGSSRQLKDPPYLDDPRVLFAAERTAPGSVPPSP